MTGENEVAFKIDAIPKGSRLERYLQELPNVIGKRDKALSFLNKVFVDSLEYILKETDAIYLPRITLNVVLTHERFKPFKQFKHSMRNTA